ncbi:hypothetical protein FBR02_11370 [Anaerolineae bacterium CFX9]|nr:hypothetical protein [Anaerolineae bacterium CFX9]
MRVRSRGLVFVSLVLVALGVLLLLNNFYLLSGFNITSLLPLLLVVVGGVLLLRGDISSTDARTFGITRGSVESATLEISAGEIDVSLRALTREGRLIAGQYAPDARPTLDVQDTHAVLRMDRAATSWLSFADWDISLARDLPWDIQVSTHLGQVNLDLSGLITQSVSVGTGFGDIRVVCPDEVFEQISLRSALGNIQVLTPTGITARITVSGPRMFRVHADGERYEQIGEHVYVTRGADPAAVQVLVDIKGTFGDAYLA